MIWTFYVNRRNVNNLETSESKTIVYYTRAYLYTLLMIRIWQKKCLKS